MLFSFLSTDGISFECLSVILWTPLSWTSLLICSSSSKLWGLPCPCSSWIGTVSAGHQPVSVHVPHVIHPQIFSLCYLKKDTSFWFFVFFSHFLCHAVFKNICQEDVTAAVCEQISAESWFGSVWAFLFDAAWFERNNEGSRKGGIMRIITVVSWCRLCFCTSRIQIFCHFTDN